MATPNVANTLANVPIFSGCTKRELGIIARASKEVDHKEGTVIAREGERVSLGLEAGTQFGIGARESEVVYDR